MLYSINKRNIRLKKIRVILLAVMFLIITMAPAADAQWPYHNYHHPSKTKHIAVGTAIGSVGGALIGGRKGALIGAGAGFGAGYGVYKYKKRKYQKRYYYYR
jgi:osmotically inducible lipoprotein OsmB